MGEQETSYDETLTQTNATSKEEVDDEEQEQEDDMPDLEPNLKEEVDGENSVHGRVDQEKSVIEGLPKESPTLLQITLTFKDEDCSMVKCCIPLANILSIHQLKQWTRIEMSGEHEEVSLNTEDDYVYMKCVSILADYLKNNPRPKNNSFWI